MIRKDRTKRILLLYNILKHLGYKVNAKYYFKCSREKCIFYNILLLNKLSYVTGVDIDKVYKALGKAVVMVRKGVKYRPKIGYKCINGRELDSEYLEFLPDLVESLTYEYGSDAHRNPVYKPQKAPANPQGNQQDTQSPRRTAHIYNVQDNQDRHGSK